MYMWTSCWLLTRSTDSRIT